MAQALEALALGDDPGDEVEDAAKPDVEVMRSSALEEVTAFKVRPPSAVLSASLAISRNTLVVYCRKQPTCSCAVQHAQNKRQPSTQSNKSSPCQTELL